MNISAVSPPAGLASPPPFKFFKSKTEFVAKRERTTSYVKIFPKTIAASRWAKLNMAKFYEQELSEDYEFGYYYMSFHDAEITLDKAERIGYKVQKDWK